MKKALIALILLVTTCIGKAQDCLIEQKGFYFLHLVLEEEGEPDRVGVIIFDKLDSLNLQKIDKSKIICHLYSNGYYLIPPGLDFETMIIKCIQGEKKQQMYFDEEYLHYSKFTAKLGKGKVVKKLCLGKGKKLQVSAIYIKADLWKIPLSEKGEINHLIDVAENCLNSDYYYSIKKYEIVRPLNPEEEQLFLKI